MSQNIEQVPDGPYVALAAAVHATEHGRLHVPAGSTVLHPDAPREPGEVAAEQTAHAVKVRLTGAGSSLVRGRMVMVSWGQVGDRRAVLVPVEMAALAGAPGWG
jgi:hypothetical protein